MPDEKQDGRKLQVANARPEDSGRGLARLSRMTMAALGLEEGDTVEIIGKRSTAAHAVAPYKEDEGLDILRIDGLQRPNDGVGSGDFVTIRNTDSRHTHRAVLALTQTNLRRHGKPQNQKHSIFH